MSAHNDGGPVDVLAVIAKHRDSHAAMALADAYSAQEYPKLRDAYAAVAALIAERDALREALLKLMEAADTSDGCQYGTLSTSFVREIAKAALPTGESA